MAHVQDPDDPTAPPLARPVAVKVIHPGVRRQIELDLELMRFGGEGGPQGRWWACRGGC